MLPPYIRVEAVLARDARDANMRCDAATDGGVRRARLKAHIQHHSHLEVSINEGTKKRSRTSSSVKHVSSLLRTTLCFHEKTMVDLH